MTPSPSVKVVGSAVPNHVTINVCLLMIYHEWQTSKMASCILLLGSEYDIYVYGVASRDVYYTSQKIENDWTYASPWHLQSNSKNISSGKWLGSHVCTRNNLCHLHGDLPNCRFSPLFWTKEGTAQPQHGEPVSTKGWPTFWLRCTHILWLFLLQRILGILVGFQ